MLDAADMLQALLSELPLWTRRLEVVNYANFPMLKDFLLQEGISKSLIISLQTEICTNLVTLQNSFHGYFVYPTKAKLAMAVLITFVTTHLMTCQPKDDKSKSFSIQHDMCIALSKIIPQFHHLQAKQLQPSY